MDVCDGLLFCHRGCGRGPAAMLLHRDIKPSNVLLHRDRTGRLVGSLGDFGISKLYPVGIGAVATTTTVYGTPGYIAPEVTYGDHPSPQSDTYALGITILRVGETVRGGGGEVPLCEAPTARRALACTAQHSVWPCPLLFCVPRALCTFPRRACAVAGCRAVARCRAVGMSLPFLVGVSSYLLNRSLSTRVRFSTLAGCDGPAGANPRPSPRCSR